MSIFSVPEVKARWAFNELNSPRTRKFYQDGRIPSLLQRRAGFGVPDPGSEDFGVLIEMFEAARGRFLHMYFDGIKGFRLQKLGSRPITWPICNVSNGFGGSGTISDDVRLRLIISSRSDGHGRPSRRRRKDSAPRRGDNGADHRRLVPYLGSSYRWLWP
jgi:hypothetical protein